MALLCESFEISVSDIQPDVWGALLAMSKLDFVTLSGLADTQDRLALYEALPSTHRPAKNQENPFDLFEAIFCINATDQEQRWQNMQSRFERLGIEHRVIRFPAVMSPTSHHIGCSLSHRMLADIAKTHDLENILVFEDDAMILDTLLEELPKNLEELAPRPWKMFYFGGCYRKSESQDLAGHEYLRSGKYLTCTHAIAYSRRFYDELMAEIPATIAETVAWCKSKCPAVDQFLYWVEDETYLATPTLSTQIELMPSVESELRERFV